MKKIGILIAFIVLAGHFSVKGQSVKAMRLNEVLVINENNFVDDYGKRSGWIELYNSSPATVDIRGCYLTNEKGNTTKYMIPKGDVLTKIPPRQHVLFWADGMAERGTFHVGFTLNPTGENYIALYDVDGKTLIAEMTVPAGQHPDVSYGLTVDGGTEYAILPKVTPSTNNVTLDSNEKIEKFQTQDSSGIGMTLTAMSVVFVGLLLLFLAFKSVGNLSIKASQRRAHKAVGNKESAPRTTAHVPGEVFAAIATALYEATEDVHDIENTVLTIQKMKRSYSPWNSRIYGMREIPRK